MKRTVRRLLACPDCSKKYHNLEHLNKHIAKTGCNHGNKLSLVDYVFPLRINKALEKFSIQHPILAI